MDRSEKIFTDNFLIKKNSILVIVAFPCHKSYEDIFAKRNLAVLSGRTVGNYIALINMLTVIDNRSLIETVALVGAHEFYDMIGIGFVASVYFYTYLIGAYIGNRSGILSKHAVS